MNAYVRPLRSLVIWLADEGILHGNPFRRSRRRAALNPLLPSEETPTKSATVADIRALEAGCAGDRPIDLRDQAIVAILVTTAARNSSVRLLRLEDIDLDRSGGHPVPSGEGGQDPRDRPPRRRSESSPPLPRTAAGPPSWVARQGGQAGAPSRATKAGSSCLLAKRSGSPLSANALSLMLTRRYHAGGGTVRSFGSHRIRHATATLLVNNGMPLDEVSRYLGHSSTDDDPPLRPADDRVARASRRRGACPGRPRRRLIAGPRRSERVSMEQPTIP